MQRRSAWAAALWVVCGGAPLSAQEVAVTLEIRGLRSAEGQVLVGVFDAPAGFPDAGAQAARRVEVRAAAGPLRVPLADLPAGPVAVSVLHDENGDYRMNSGWFGRPREGFGVSNNPRIRFGPPDFADAEVTPAAGETLVIEMRYF